MKKNSNSIRFWIQTSWRFSIDEHIKMCSSYKIYILLSLSLFLPFSFDIINKSCTLPEINAGHTLIKIGLIDFTDSTLRKENANEWWIISFGPIFYWEWQWICVLLGWIRKFQKTVHRYLYICGMEIHYKYLLLSCLIWFFVSIYRDVCIRKRAHTALK